MFLGFGGYGLYLLFSLPALLFGLWAQMKVQGAFNKYSRVRTMTGVTGAQIARRILDMNGLSNVKVEQTGGLLSDHYDPTTRTLRLSPDVYSSPSIAAAGVAAHETGHALQHQQGYAMLQLRSMMVPTVQIGSWIGPIIFMVGFWVSGTLGNSLAWVGVLIFAAVAADRAIGLGEGVDVALIARAVPEQGCGVETAMRVSMVRDDLADGLVDIHSGCLQ